MQLQELSDILQRPETLKPEQITELKSLVDTYPYFQPIRALYLKALKNKDSYKYNNALKVTAAHTTDRSILFDFITSEIFNQNLISEQIKQNSEYIKAIEVNAVDDISIHRSVTIDDALKQHIEATEGVLDPNLFNKKEGSDSVAEPIKSNSAEEKLKIGKPLEFSTSETHSFSEWLKITSFKPIDRTEEADKTEAPLINKLETIDRFILENPKIKPTVNTPKPKLVDNSDDIEDSLMTETLARIYLEQKNYEKAIQSYRILSLKYPEKSSFFADQIKAVKELKERNNTDND
ncbi:hypothetical protein DFQ05_1047 [Winogradskyella wandonensis]|uniref:Tetratricopeptide repeat protein n=1 Tax=Winogradskyella wandonensis TaxID=1442586 RepID=A0A4R1KRS3_9FLAO|nr:hypothetical protein [Winogradskyella wandonensis]TCK67273.1 hypothetical protein DFQ05_1047 [Winogradskyella wandonensis]